MARGIVVGALGGLGEGMLQAGKQLGDYAARSTLQQEAAEIAKQRDVALELLKRETHAVNAQTDIGNIPARGAAETDVKVKAEDATRPGRLQTKRGEMEIEAEGKRNSTPQEHLDYYTAAADRLNAEAQAIRDGLKYRDKSKPEKPQLPNVHVNKDAEGNITLVDQNSGAIGTIVKGAPAVPGEKRWFGPNDPDKPAGADTVRWTNTAGQHLPNGLADLYPDLRSRTPAGAPSGGPSRQDRPPRPSYGQVMNGFRFVGTGDADPSDRKNWEKVSAPANAPKPSARPEVQTPNNQEQGIPREFLGPNGEYIPPSQRIGGRSAYTEAVDVASQGIEKGAGIISSATRADEQRRRTVLMDMARKGTLQTPGDIADARRLGIIK